MTDEHTPKRDETPTSAPDQPGVEEAAPPLPGSPIDITPESLPPAHEATPTYEVAETPVAAPAEAVEESEPAAAPEPPLRDAAHPLTIEEPSVPPPSPEVEEIPIAAESAEQQASEEVPPEAPEGAAAPKTKKPRKSAKTAKAVEEVAAEQPSAETATAIAEAAPESKKKWYAVKVQSGREESIKAAIERKVKIEGLEQCFGQIVIPVEEVNEKKKVKVKVKDKKTGDVETTTQERNVVKKIKKFPGYIFAEVEFNDEILYVFRETSGVGDFVGIPARRGQGGERLAPTPMTEDEVQAMLLGAPVPGGGRKGAKKTVVKLDFEKGDKVRIKNGAFAGHEAEVKAITEAKDPTDSPKVTVIVTMWGRPVDVDLDYWEVDKA